MVNNEPFLILANIALRAVILKVYYLLALLWFLD